MITLFTAPNGCGKTQRVVEDLLNLRLDEEKKQQSPRFILTNINELDASLGCSTLDSIGGVQNWQEAPDGALFIVDEAQFEMPVRNSAQKPPVWIEKLATHRHRGFDFWLITQSPKIIDPFVRPLISSHFHGYRPFQMKQTSWLEHSYCEESPKVNVKPIVKKRKFNTEVFKFYKSATTHTDKARPPLKLLITFGIAVFCIICALGYVAYSLYNMYHQQQGTQQVKSTPQTQQSAAGSPKNSGSSSIVAAIPPSDFKAFPNSTVDFDYPADSPVHLSFIAEISSSDKVVYLLCSSYSQSSQSSSAQPAPATESGVGDSVTNTGQQIAQQAVPHSMNSAQQNEQQQKKPCDKTVNFSDFYSYRYDTKRRVILIFATKFSQKPEYFVSNPEFFQRLDAHDMLASDVTLVSSIISKRKST